jgi:hypothetical protein
LRKRAGLLSCEDIPESKKIAFVITSLCICLFYYPETERKLYINEVVAIIGLHQYICIWSWAIKPPYKKAMKEAIQDIYMAWIPFVALTIIYMACKIIASFIKGYDTFSILRHSQIIYSSFGFVAGYSAANHLCYAVRWSIWLVMSFAVILSSAFYYHPPNIFGVVVTIPFLVQSLPMPISYKRVIASMIILALCGIIGKGSSPFFSLLAFWVFHWLRRNGVLLSYAVAVTPAFAIIVIGLALSVSDRAIGDIISEWSFFYYFDDNCPTRLLLWLRAVEVFISNPMFGVSFGESIFGVEIYNLLTGIDLLYLAPHNSFIGMLARLGIIGFVLIMSSTFMLLVLVLKDNGRDHDSFSELALMSFIIALSLSVLNVIIESPTQALLYWFTLGISYSRYTVRK